MRKNQTYICEHSDYLTHAKEIPLGDIGREVRIAVTRDISSKQPVHCRWHAAAGGVELGAPSYSQPSRVGSAACRVHRVLYMAA
jgi:hypothetical protein